MTQSNATKIGPYTLIRKLGRGAFGVVWLAEKRTRYTSTKFALKLPRDEDVDLEAVKQEAQLWEQASGHPNVLPIIEADDYDGQIVIVSEYAPDGSLAKWMGEHGGKAPSVEAAVEMSLGILAGLEHLHHRNIIHRDLKPDNILLQGKTPRLADFGIARVLKTTGESSVASGTPVYMAPEAFDGKRSQQTDLWAVGVILFQLLAGSLPFTQPDMASLLAAIITREPEPLPSHVPQPIQEFVRYSLVKEPSKRFQSATRMRQALSEVNPSQISSSNNEAEFGTAPTRLFELPINTPGPTIASPPFPHSEHSTDPVVAVAQPVILRGRKRRTRKSWLSISLAVVLLLSLSIGVNLYLRRNVNVPAVNSPNLQSFTFETVTLDAGGHVINRKPGQANYFTEEIGNGAKLEMVSVAGGTFTMGSPITEIARKDKEGPRHQVTVPSLFMGKYEITQAQWKAVSKLPQVKIDLPQDPAGFKSDDRPVDNISWEEAMEFCARLSKLTGRTYRLPSEAEWEYSCRAGTDTPFSFGETLTTEVANFNGDNPNVPYGIDRKNTIPVGSLGVANAFGLFDMHGNVGEWCLDMLHLDYQDAPNDGSAWQGSRPHLRILRGCAWNSDVSLCRSAQRISGDSNERGANVGLRVVMTIDRDKGADDVAASDSKRIVKSGDATVQVQSDLYSYPRNLNWNEIKAVYATSEMDQEALAKKPIAIVRHDLTIYIANFKIDPYGLNPRNKKISLGSGQAIIVLKIGQPLAVPRQQEGLKAGRYTSRSPEERKTESFAMAGILVPSGNGGTNYISLDNGEVTLLELGPDTVRGNFKFTMQATTMSGEFAAPKLGQVDFDSSILQ